MVSKPLDMSLVYKRERYLLGEKHVVKENASLNDEISRIMSKSNTQSLASMVEHFVGSTSDSYTSDIKLLEQLYDNNLFNILEDAVQRLTKGIIPTIENKEIKSAILVTSEANIGDVNKDRLIETFNTYKSIDRIIDNHKKMSKRFALESVQDIAKSDKKKCYSLCEMVDTYDLNPFIKFNIALEEMSYICYHGGISMDESSMVEYITNYFLLRENNSDEDINSYIRAIKESKVLSETADISIKYLMNKDSEDNSILSEYAIPKTWKEKVNDWKIDPNKSVNKLVSICKENFNDSTAITSILSTLNEYVTINQIDYNLGDVFNNSDKIVTEAASAINIIHILENAKAENAESLIENLRVIWMESMNDIQYADKDRTNSEYITTFSTNDIDKFTMHNLIADAQSTADFLDKIDSTMQRNNLNRDMCSIDDTKFNENTGTIADYVDENDHILLRLRSYNINENAKLEDVSKFMESTVKCINNSLYGRNVKAFYSFRNESTVDVYLRSKYNVILTLSEESLRSFPNSVKGDLIRVFESAEESDKLAGMPTADMIVNLAKKQDNAANATTEEVSLLCDILGPLEEDSNIMQEYALVCESAGNSRSNRIKNTVRNHLAYDIESASYIPVSARLEALGVYTGDIDPLSSKIFAEAVARNGKSLNTIKLAWQAFKKDAKHMSAKEKEMCRDMDAGFNNFMRGFQSLYKTDHREAIIKGQVCPSLSKMLKIAIALAGVGLAAGSPYVPALILACGFLANKHATDVERNKMIDELDIELKVVQREIERAENSGSTKKYRQLLTIQRNLMRERQKLYYKLAVKGKKVNPIDQGYMKGGY